MRNKKINTCVVSVASLLFIAKDIMAAKGIYIPLFTSGLVHTQEVVFQQQME